MKNILIIEDDISIGNVLEETLTREGGIVYEVFTGIYGKYTTIGG